MVQIPSWSTPPQPSSGPALGRDRNPAVAGRALAARRVAASDGGATAEPQRSGAAGRDGRPPPAQRTGSSPPPSTGRTCEGEGLRRLRERREPVEDPAVPPAMPACRGTRLGRSGTPVQPQRPPPPGKPGPRRSRPSAHHAHPARRATRDPRRVGSSGFVAGASGTLCRTPPTFHVEPPLQGTGLLEEGPGGRARCPVTVEVTVERRGPQPSPAGVAIGRPQRWPPRCSRECTLITWGFPPRQTPGTRGST